MRLASALLALPLILISSLAQADPATSQPAAPLDPAIQKAVAAGVNYIVSKQNPDGSLDDFDGEHTAVTSLAIMALKSAGVKMSQPTPAAAAMRKAMTWLLQDARLRSDGYFGTDGSQMYTHGIATLMLAQMSASGADENQNAQIKNRLTKAVQLILAAHKTNQLGGWRYTPDSTDADVAVTAWQVRALAAAARAGIAVPKEDFSRAADFIKSCVADSGGLAYVPGTPARWSSSAAGLLALELCGQAHSPEAKSAYDYLQARPVPGDRAGYLYASPAYVAAMGAISPDDFETARSSVADTVLRFQQPDGSWLGWEPDNSHGQVYCTSLVILSLTAKPPVIEPEAQPADHGHP